MRSTQCLYKPLPTADPTLPLLPLLLQVGDSLTASLTVERCSGSRVSFRTLCRRDSPGAAGAVVVEGTALALISPPPTPPLQR